MPYLLLSAQFECYLALARGREIEMLELKGPLESSTSASLLYMWENQTLEEVSRLMLDQC